MFERPSELAVLTESFRVVPATGSGRALFSKCLPIFTGCASPNIDKFRIWLRCDKPVMFVGKCFVVFFKVVSF